MLLRTIVIAFAALLLLPIVISAAIPSLTLGAMGVNTSRWRQAPQDYAARLEDIGRCADIIRYSSDPRARSYRSPGAACSLCANLLAAVPDPAPSPDHSREVQRASAERADFLADTRLALSRRDETLSAAFAERAALVARFESGELQPVRHTIDLQSAQQCVAD